MKIQQDNLFDAFGGDESPEAQELASLTKWQPITELPELKGVKRVSFDTETDGLNCFLNKPIGYSVTYRQPWDNKVVSFYVPFGHSNGNIDKEKAIRWAQQELAQKTLVMCNAKFDTHMAGRVGIDFEKMGCKLRDISFAGALLDDSRGVKQSLDALGHRFVGEGKSHVEGGAIMNRLREVPSWMVGPYAERDAWLTFMVDERQRTQIISEKLEKVLDLENSLIYTICHIERNGSIIDRPKLELWEHEVRIEAEKLMLALWRKTGFNVNPNSSQDMMKVYRFLNLGEPKYTESGQPSFTDEEIKKHESNETIAMVLRARRLNSLHSKYLQAYLQALDKDNRIRFALNQMRTASDKDRDMDADNPASKGTISGRFSSTGSAGEFKKTGYCFNVQQVVKAEKQIESLGEGHIIRELFVPADPVSDEFFACDAKGIEYRLFAHFTAAPKVLEAYKADPNTSFHEIVLKLALPYMAEANLYPLLEKIGFTFDAAEDTPAEKLLKQVLATTEGKMLKHVYKRVKNTNFARLYGAGLRKIALMLGLSLAETEKFLANYDLILPEAKSYSDATSKEAERNGYVRTLMGRKARFDSESKLHSAANRVIQGTAADIFKLKLLRLYNERDTLGITALRQPVHDEQAGDKNRSLVSTRRMIECFNTQELELRVPILWDFKTGANWYACG
jgi:DNA polymerase-1